MAMNLPCGQSDMSFKKQILGGQYVRLEPLQKKHLVGLKLAIEDGNLYQLMVTNVPHPDELQAFYDKAVTDQQIGEALVFATLDQKTDQVIGSSRFMHTDWTHNRTEIGFTFIAKRKQRTAINTEAKLLMLKHAFDVLNLNRVAFVTDYLNQTSRTAILRLGAKQEGILRNHMVMPDGRVRDSVIFSIIKNEWPGIETYLMEKLQP